MMEGKANNKYSNLPAGWEMKRLKDVAINCGDYGANAPALPYKAGDIRYIRITDIDDYGHLISDDQASLDETIAQNYLLKDNDILFARTGDTVGKSLLYKSYMGRAAYAGYLIRFTLDEKLILPEYFDAIAKSDIFEAFKISMKRIGAKPNINSREYGIFRFPMPLNLDEQKGFAKLFTKVDEAIASVQNSIAAAERLKKSLMQNLLTGKMKPDGTFRTPDEFYIDEKFGKVPTGWEVKRIKDFGEIQTGKTPPTDEPEVFSDKENGFMFITPGDLDVAKYIEETERYVSEKGIRYSYVLPKGSVCEVCIGSTIGKIGITTAKCCSNQQITSVIVNNEHDAEYLYYAMLSRREHFKSVAGINATPQINKSGYSKYRVLRPKDKLEQIAIAKRISSVDKSINEQDQKIKSLKRLKKSLMQNLLTGKVVIDI